MSVSQSIEHKGIIQSIQGDKITVGFVALSGCASCHAKGFCSAADMQEKSIEVHANPDQFKIGDQVSVILKQSLGFRAVWLGYVLPFILVLTILIVLSEITGNEAISGLGALSVLVPYYLILLIFRKKIQKKFSFNIQKID